MLIPGGTLALILQVKSLCFPPESSSSRSFPAEAWQFWPAHGAFVGEVLHPETPLTFAKAAMASREYALEYPIAGLPLPLKETTVAWCLVRLLACGMVGLGTTAVPTA